MRYNLEFCKDTHAELVAVLQGARCPLPLASHGSTCSASVSDAAQLAEAEAVVPDKSLGPQSSSVGQTIFATLISVADDVDGEGDNEGNEGGEDIGAVKAPGLLTLAFVDPVSGSWRAAADVEAALAHLDAIRTRAIHMLASEEEKRGRWIFDQCVDWWQGRILSRTDMATVLAWWESEVEQADMTVAMRRQIADLLADGSRASKKRARQLKRGVFQVHLQRTFGRPELAKAFVKVPCVQVETVFRAWEEYRRSPEYAETGFVDYLVK